jgi:putative hydrolase of the HAD superfamily
MIIKANSQTFFVFDLDDTLFFEIDYLKSAFKSIARNIEPKLYMKLYNQMLSIYLSGGNTFEKVISQYPNKKLNTDELLCDYRNHFPKIRLREGVLEMLLKIKANNGKIGIITNGRGTTQRNKIESLGLIQIIDEILISEEFGFEKPNEAIYKHFMRINQKYQYYYFGDNLTNDFITAKRFGWFCIGIIDKKHIRKFETSEFSLDFLPHVFIRKFTEIEIF